uniref:Uncharacterized protein n=1 Tax=Rhizophora mucronata TaxID=61149 RepID=A0A2P2IY47_RHIMU
MHVSSMFSVELGFLVKLKPLLTAYQ